MITWAEIALVLFRECNQAVLQGWLMTNSVFRARPHPDGLLPDDWSTRSVVGGWVGLGEGSDKLASWRGRVDEDSRKGAAGEHVHVSSNSLKLVPPRLPMSRGYLRSYRARRRLYSPRRATGRTGPSTSRASSSTSQRWVSSLSALVLVVVGENRSLSPLDLSLLRGRRSTKG